MVKDNSPLEKIDDHYDIVIVGAGITGAGLFRDLAIHGQKCLLIDKKDFSSQTSQSSSKMLHGGIRYLENFDFGLVWEALHEKNLWLKLAPHLCYEKPFFLPIFKNSSRPLWMIKIGLFLYDLLSGFENSPHKILRRAEAIKNIPGINQKGLTGAGVYHDAIMEDAKLTLEVIYDGLCENGNEALNYTELIDFEHSGDHSQIKLKDTLTGKEKSITASEVIFATGPFTDRLFSKLNKFPWRPKLLPSKGSHLWIRKDSLPISEPMVMNPDDGRVIFVIPQRGAILIGTTEEEVEQDYFDIKPSEDEIEYLLENLNEYFPNANVTKDCILSSFSGIRPLVKESDENDLGKTAREHKCFQPYSNVHVIIGGKYTTFRVMGQEISRQIVTKKGLMYNSSATKKHLRKKSIVSPFPKPIIKAEDIEKVLKNEKVRTFEDLLKRRLGIPSKTHWKQEIAFEDFFSSMLPLLKEYMDIDLEQIKNF